MSLKSSFAAVVVSLICAHAVGAPALNQRTCHLPGSEEGLRCLTLPAPLDYGKPAGPALGLHVTVAPAFRESARPDPLFILAGGPGEAGSQVLSMLGHTFRRVRATRDIVFIDQRGTGLSGKLDCDTDHLPESMSDAEQEAALRTCLAGISRPLSAFTTLNAARDIERVRAALGYQKVNLWGGSYGTRLAQVYARAFPEAVRTLILDGVAAPDQVIPAGGRDGQAALDLLFKQCQDDRACHKAFPALRAEFASLSARVRGGAVPVAVADPRTAELLKVSMDSARFLATVHNVLYSALDSRRLPFLIHSAHQGRWAPFIARRNVATDYSLDGGPAMVLHLAVVCAEDVPRLTARLREDDARNAFLGNSKIDRLIDVCKMVNVPAAPYQTPATILAPALLLSGALDPVTPPHRAHSAANHMARAQHLVVANAGHGISSLGCTPRLLREFLDQPSAPLDAKCLTEIPAGTFQLGSAGPHP